MKFSNKPRPIRNKYKFSRKTFVIAIMVVVISGVVGLTAFYKLKSSKVNSDQQAADKKSSSRGPQNTGNNKTGPLNKQDPTKPPQSAKVLSDACKQKQTQAKSAQQEFAKENKRHAAKLAELKKYWEDNGGVDTDGYRQDLDQENKVFYSNSTKFLNTFRNNDSSKC